MEPEVKKFSELMQAKLNKNKNKPCPVMNPEGEGRTWKGCSTEWLMFRLQQEFDELKKAIKEAESPQQIANECADVANFSMFIADINGGLR